MDIEGFEKDLRRYMKTFAQACAKEASKQITRQAKTCIEMFYLQYIPTCYRRTENLKDNSYVSYYHNNGRAYYGGTRITSDFMVSNYQDDPFVVAKLSWDGWHGSPTGYGGRFPSIRTTPPLNTLQEFVNDDKFQNFIMECGNRAASSQNYNYIKVTKGGWTYGS